MPCARFSGTPASSVSQLNAVFSTSKRSRTPYPTMSSLGCGAKSADDSKRQNRPHVEYPIPSGQNVTLGLSVHLSNRPLRSSPSGQNVAFCPPVGRGGRTPGSCRDGGGSAQALRPLSWRSSITVLRMVAGESVTYFLALMAFDARAGGLARMISVARATAFRTVLFGSFRLGCN